MISLCGYDLYLGINALNPNPTVKKTIDSIKLRNAIFDYLYGTYSININPNKPLEWNFSTIMFAQFMNTLNAGNLSENLSNISAVNVVRTNIDTGDKITVYEKAINNPTVEDFNFIFKDFAGKNGGRYVYSVIPVLKSGISSSSVQTDPVTVQFKNVFLSDNTYSYEMVADVKYGNGTQKINVGTFEPIGRKYPVYVSNADTNYQIGSVSSKVIGNYFDLKEFNKQDITKQKDEILKFLTNRKPKILKDTNGNMWLIAITGAPSIEYDNKYNAGIMDISFNFMEIGDATNEKDMMNCGIVPFTL